MEHVEDLRVALTAMKRVRDDADARARADTGICGVVSDAVLLTEPRPGMRAAHRRWQHVRGHLHDAFRTWPHRYEGCISHPVPPTKASRTRCDIAAAEHYAKSMSEGTLWDQGTEYGRLRMDLLKHTIRHFEELING